MLGQNVWICPKNNIVVSINSGNNELFQESPALTIIRAYLGQDLSADAPADYKDLCELKTREKNFFRNSISHNTIEFSCGHTFTYLSLSF